MESSIEEIITNRHTWKINTNVHKSIGKGAYGIVYKSAHEKYKEIAAKSMTGNTQRLVTRDVERLLQLEHKHMVRVYDLIKQTRCCG